VKHRRNDLLYEHWDAANGSEVPPTDRDFPCETEAMNANRNTVLTWTKRAEDEELLDRATVLRGECEPAAVEMILSELAVRGYSDTAIANHGVAKAAVCVRRPDGSVRRCWRCSAPAIDRVRRWWKFFGLLPVVPVRRPVCARHA
jgi:hypothetical protein